jgi:hypothetical protein
VATAVKQVDKAVQKEADTLAKALFHLQAQRFETPAQAVATLQKLFKKSHYHPLSGCQLTLHFMFAHPTLRWLFQAIDGIDCLRYRLDGQSHCFIHGLSPLKIRILTLFGPEVSGFYRLSP